MEKTARLSSSGVRPSGEARLSPGGQDDAEIIELLELAKSLRPGAPEYRQALASLISDTEAELEGASPPIERERISERFARALRRLWLEASAFSTSSSYRSPPTAETTKTATGRRIEFGYERDLQPVHLEERCRTFFDVPPPGWSADHILLSSGQSAMAALLHALEGSSLFGDGRRLSFLHLGSYFETAQIVSLFSSFLQSSGHGRSAVEDIGRLDGDIVIVEPVFCDGDFGILDLDTMLAAHGKKKRRRVYVFDTTLCGLGAPVEPLLRGLEQTTPVVFRIYSGLKLFQAGLELSSVGILSVFAPERGVISASEIGSRIRRIRTLLGLGLSFFEVAALDVPWFLHRGQTQTYERAVFDNNAALAREVAAENQLFDGVFHPAALDFSDRTFGAPYCSFRLRERDPAQLDALEQFLHREAERRDLQFDLGGSFGFRGHRFEIVRPETGEKPFLRVALGRRTGWSRDRIIELMTEVSGAPNLAQLLQDEMRSTTKGASAAPPGRIPPSP